MTISGYSNAIVDVMLGWLKGLANWVLRLFNLAGSVSSSPLLWLSRNWLKLLIFFLVLGIVLDRLVWLVRWRPYWVWFRKERVIVNDSRFFAKADMDAADDSEGDLRDNWDEHDYVVASTVVKRQESPKPGAASSKGKGGTRKDRRGDRRDRKGSTKVQRHNSRQTAGPGDRPNGQQTQEYRPQRRATGAKSPDSIFAGKLQKPEVSDQYEDEVFNVSNLPVFDGLGDGKAKKKSKSRS